jgi:hypothetical protein
MPVDVVSRDAEARAVADFLVPASTVPSALVEGEAGIGETTLWLAAVALARGFQVLAAHPAAARCWSMPRWCRRSMTSAGGIARQAVSRAAMPGEPTMKP